jgi:hypothetical protein
VEQFVDEARKAITRSKRKVCDIQENGLGPQRSLKEKGVRDALLFPYRLQLSHPLPEHATARRYPIAMDSEC